MADGLAGLLGKPPRPDKSPHAIALQIALTVVSKAGMVDEMVRGKSRTRFKISVQP